jgi:hypothetical protein
MKNMIVGETTTKEVQTMRYKLLGQSGPRVSERSPGDHDLRRGLWRENFLADVFLGPEKQSEYKGPKWGGKTRRAINQTWLSDVPEVLKKEIVLITRPATRGTIPFLGILSIPPLMIFGTSVSPAKYSFSSLTTRSSVLSEGRTSIKRKSLVLKSSFFIDHAMMRPIHRLVSKSGGVPRIAEKISRLVFRIFPSQSISPSISIILSCIPRLEWIDRVIFMIEYLLAGKSVCCL